MKRALVTVAMFASLAAFIAAQQPPPQQPAPTFRSGVDLVVLDVSVLDGDRHPIRGLTADDFTVLENGKPQPIKTFTAIDLPDVVEQAPAVWMRDVHPDVTRNDLLSGRRIVVLVLDDATPMPLEEVPRMKMMARKVIERLGPDDLAAVVYAFSKKSGQEFTTDRARLLAAVDRFNGGADRDNVLGPFNPDPAQQTTVSLAFDQYNPHAVQLYSAVVTTLRSVAESLVDLPERRKALVFASVGLPLDIEATNPQLISLENPGADNPATAQNLYKDLQKTFETAQRANVNIYGLDPGGLRAPAGRYDALAGSGDLAGSPGRLNRDFLQALSANTGGFTIAESNRSDEDVAQIFRENGSYYLLGYQPPEPRAAGKLRRVEVRVNREGAMVRSRSGYYQPAAAETKKAAPAAIDKALAATLPVADLAMQTAVAPFALAGRREAAVVTTIALRQPVPEGTERVTNEVTVHLSAYDVNGKRRAGDALSARIGLRPGGGGDAVFEVLSRLDLEPGHYQVRVAAESSLRGKAGSVYFEIDVPDFRGAPLSASGLVLAATPGVLAARKDVVSSLVPVVPTAMRDFLQSQRVTGFVRLYQGGNDAPVPMSLWVRIRDAGDTVVFEQSSTLGADKFSSSRAADHQFDLPMADLKPGPHLLTVEATKGNTSLRRDVRFTVR